MRTAAVVIGMIAFMAGFALQYGAWLMAWLSRFFGLNTPAPTYADFVEAVATTLTLGNGLLRILVPWALMAIGLILLAVSRAGRSAGVSS
jgi:hypothetical protein